MKTKSKFQDADRSYGDTTCFILALSNHRIRVQGVHVCDRTPIWLGSIAANWFVRLLDMYITLHVRFVRPQLVISLISHQLVYFIANGTAATRARHLENISFNNDRNKNKKLPENKKNS